MGRAYSTGVDAHTHLDFPAFAGDRPEVLERAREAGIRGWVIAGADPACWDRVLRVAAAIDGVAVLGLHPWWAGDLEPAALAAHLERLAELLPAAGLGECGLDHVRARDDATHAAQRRALRPQLALARERDVPVVLHCVRAYGTLLDLLERDGVPAAGGVFHSWSGPAELVPRAVDLGLHLSVGPLVLRQAARKVREAVRAIPGDRLLLETDCPDQAPPGVERGEPAHVVQVAEEVAILRDEHPADLLHATARNATRLWPGVLP